MSHIVMIKTEIRDVAALTAACARLGLPMPVRETARLFSGEATGHCVRLPGWRYPIVCDTESGRVQYDDFEGMWGEQAELHKLLQMYTCEKAKLEARRQGHSVLEQQLADGSIKLTIQVGDAA